MIQGWNPGRDKKFLFLPRCPEWLWWPSSLLFNGYWGLCPSCQSGCCVRLTSDHPVPWLRINGAMLPTTNHPISSYHIQVQLYLLGSEGVLCFLVLSENSHVWESQYHMRFQAFTAMHVTMWCFWARVQCRFVKSHGYVRMSCYSHHLDARRMPGSSCLDECIGWGMGGV
jgi:hypothetical protein